MARHFLSARLINRYEHASYNDMLDKLHYLGDSGREITKSLRYIIENQAGEWVALLDFGYAALKNGARESWIGWDSEQRSNRLRYVLNNTRFLVLPWMKHKYRFIASQALALVAKRISSDWEYYHGHHILLLETFVDEKREGTCYRAANWLYVGETSGFGKRGKSYYEHGNKKKVFLYPLHRKAREILSERGFPHPLLVKETRSMIDLNKVDIKGLEEFLKSIPDPRKKSHYPLSKLLLLAACAYLSGYDSYIAIGQYGENLSHEARRRLGFRIWQMPDESCIRKTLNQIDENLFFTRVRDWVKTQGFSLKKKTIAIDGKSMRASQTDDGEMPHILSAVVHETGVIVGQQEVGTKTNEIPEAIALLRNLDLRKSVVTADAMHTQVATANHIIKNGGDYVLPVKDNQFLLALNIERLHQGSFSPCVSNSRKRTRTNRNTKDTGSKGASQDCFPWSQTSNRADKNSRD